MRSDAESRRIRYEMAKNIEKAEAEKAASQKKADEKRRKENEQRQKENEQAALKIVRVWRKGYVTEAVAMAASDASLDDICDAAESRAVKLWNDIDAPLGLVVGDAVPSVKAHLLDKARKDAKSEVIRVRMLPIDQRQPGPYIEPADESFPIRHPDSNRG